MSTNLLDAHNQWRNRPADQRFETLQALRDSVHSRRLRSRATDIDCSKLAVEDRNGRLVVNSEIQPSEPTHWAFGQLATQVKAPASYLRTLPMDLVVRNLEHGFKNTDRESVKFMTIASEDDDKPNTLQAVTSATYGRIWDADVVDSVARVVERTGGKFTNPKAYSIDVSTGQIGAPRPSGLYASDHDCFAFMIDGGSRLDTGPRAKLNRGFIAWNSETGAKTFGLMTFLFNEVCGNHIIWGASEVNKLLIRHTSGGPYRFDAQAAPMLQSYVEQSAKPIEDCVRRAQERLLPAIVDVDTLSALTSPVAKFSRAEIKSAIDFAKAEEGDCRTLWQLVQGFTAYARGFEFIDARVDLETRAGKLLNLAQATAN